MTVYYSTPFKRGNIGGGINEFIALLPAGAWVCIRDADTLFLTPRQQFQIEEITQNDPPFDLIGCVTNRLRMTYQLHGLERSENSDILHHIAVAKQLEESHWCEVAPMQRVMAGVFLLFRKSLWERVKFEENTVSFDEQFSRDVNAIGGRIGIARGLYIWHTYRLGNADINNIDHLIEPIPV